MASRDKWTFGGTSLQRIVEIEDSMMPPFEIYGDCTQAHLDQNRHWLVPRFQNPDNDRLIITIQSFLVRQQGLTILVDTCGGNDKERVRPHFHKQNRPWLETLRKAGVQPEDIDIVLCTHLHVDHVGWNTRLENGRWVPTFPKARYLIAQREWDYWRNDRLRRRPGAVVRRSHASSAADPLSGMEHALLRRSGDGAANPDDILEGPRQLRAAGVSDAFPESDRRQNRARRIGLRLYL
jgi:glyoxylase-like metal-dependent hydrolase (beta-lactamase superfamily II)